MRSVSGDPESQIREKEIRDCSGKQYEPINIVDRTSQAAKSAISSDRSAGSVSLLGKVTNPELCLNKASYSFAKRIAKWSCESAQGPKGCIKDVFKWFFECRGTIKTIHRDESRKNTPIKWGGQVFNYHKKEDYSIEGVSGKKITLISTDESESLTFNTAVDSFYRVGDYVVINRRECKEERLDGAKPKEPDGRTSILGIDKFKEILGKAEDPEVRYKLETDMAGVYGPKDVMEQIGPKIFQETKCLILNSDVIYPDELEKTKTFLNKEGLSRRDSSIETGIHWPEIKKPYDLFVRLFLPDSEQSTVKFKTGLIKTEYLNPKKTHS